MKILQILIEYCHHFHYLIHAENNVNKNLENLYAE